MLSNSEQLEMSNAARGVLTPCMTSTLNRRFNNFGSSCHSFRIEAVRRNGNCISTARLEWDCLLGKDLQSSLVVYGRRPASKNFAARKAKYLLDALQEMKLMGRDHGNLTAEAHESGSERHGTVSLWVCGNLIRRV